MKTYLNELLDDAKNRANITSDNALATVIDIPNGWITEYRKDPPKRHPSTDIATKLAILAGRKEMDVIASIELMTTKNEKKREFWRGYIEKQGIVATAGVIGLGLSLLATPEPAQANVLQLPNYGAHHSVLNSSEIYIMRIFEGWEDTPYTVFSELTFLPNYSVLSSSSRCIAKDRSFAGLTGLCSKWWPLTAASLRTVGPVSPLTRMHGSFWD